MTGRQHQGSALARTQVDECEATIVDANIPKEKLEQ
jgi:hypothetical protein